MKLYGIKIHGMYLEKIKIDEESNEVAIITTSDMEGAYTSKSKEKTAKLAVVITEETELDIELFELKVKIKEKILSNL
ncbi:MAG: hypothetical protein ACRDCC_10640 [Culicoidibacterales bacterium]